MRELNSSASKPSEHETSPMVRGSASMAKSFAFILSFALGWFYFFLAVRQVSYACHSAFPVSEIFIRWPKSRETSSCDG